MEAIEAVTRGRQLPGDDDPRRVAHAQRRAGHRAIRIARSCRLWRARLDGGIHQVVPSDYRNPAALPGGGVLVVGASATGIQLADEIQASGRQVVLSTGHHLRVPRRYRGRDIMWWLDRAGILDETEESVYDVETSRHAPSFQLVGRPDHATLNLNTFAAPASSSSGVCSTIDGHRVHFDDDLVKTTAAADAKLASSAVAAGSPRRQRRRSASSSTNPSHSNRCGPRLSARRRTCT